MDPISLIKKYEDLLRLSSPSPYPLHLQTHSGQVLSVVGVSHTMRPGDSLITYLRDAFKEFEALTESKTVVIEKRIKMPAASFEGAVQMFGEAGAVHWLATDAGLPIVCPEPKYRDITVELCKMFDPADVCYRQIGEAMGWRTKIQPTLSAEDNLQRLIEDRKKYADIYGFEPTVAWFVEKHRAMFGDQDIGDDDFWSKSNTGFGSHTVFLSILHATGNYRNRVIFDTIAKIWDEGHSIFMVYGGAHIMALEPALRMLVEGGE